MEEKSLSAMIDEGFREADRGNTLVALMHLEEVLDRTSNPEVTSYLAYCLAKERGQFQRALDLCREALEKEPSNAVHYLNLGRVYLAAGRRKNAVHIFRKALRVGRNRNIVEELERLGLRKAQPVPFLTRDNPLNKYMGKLLSRMGLR